MRLTFAANGHIFPPLIPMNFQVETQARRILGRWRGASEAHTRSGLPRASNEAGDPIDQRISLNLKAI
jgi:hypothetical protein